MPDKLILASNSPRRRLLLQQFDMDFEVFAADIDEQWLVGEAPDAMTLRLAEEKARAVCSHFGVGYRVLGGDTTVSIDNEILGKPADRSEAVDMLTRLSGKTHLVFSAVALIEDGQCNTRLSTTQVTFHRLSASQIEGYCDSSDPYDKAGAYGIQSGAAQFVRELKGSYSGVVGLPLWETHQLLFPC